MGYYPVRYVSRVIIYEHKMFIRVATGPYLQLATSGALDTYVPVRTTLST